MATGPDQTAFARCIAFLRRLDEQQAERRVPFRYGVAYFNDSLPLVWSLNALALQDGVTASAEELSQVAERLQGPAGLRHRKVVTEDDAVGARLAPGFRRLGWHAQPLVVMVYAGGGRPVSVADVHELDFGELEPVWRAGAAFAMGAEEAAQVTGQRRIVGVAGSARYFAIRRDARVASYCELYTDGELGQIEGVLTEPPYRGRGLASAVVTRARLESEAAGHRLTFLIADEDDWPRELYRKLGFTTIGRIWDFLRRPANRPP